MAMEQPGNVNILLVDDRPDKMLALETVIGDLGNIVKAQSGKEALRCAMNYEFAVILLDVNMPGMDGFETAALIRKRASSERTPIIFITSFYSDNDTHMARGYSLGAVDYILAPVVPEVLRAKVSVFVDLFKKTEQIKGQAEERVQLALAQAAQAAAEAAEHRAAFLGEVSTVLASSLDYHVTLDRVARLSVPEMGDYCTIDIINSDGAIQRAAMAHADESKAAMMNVLNRRYPEVLGAPHGVAQVLRSAEPELIPEVTEALLQTIARDAEHLSLLRALGLKSYMIVPLQIRNKTLGAITFATGSNQKYTSANLVISQDLARRTAIAVDNAMLYRETKEAAARLKLLSEVASSLLKTDNPSALIDSLSRLLAMHLDVELYFCHLVQEQDHNRALFSYGGINPEAAEEIERMHIDCLSFMAVQHEPLIIDNPAHAPAIMAGLVQYLGVTVFACFPMLAANRLSGAFFFGSRRRARFSLDEFTLMQVFCNQIAVALERVRLINEAKHRADALAEANRAKDEFMAVMSHELRTPLTPILGWTRMIGRKPSDKEKVMQGIAVIERNALAQAKLIDDLLDVSRIITGKLKLTMRSMEMIAVINSGLDAVRSAAEAKEIRLESDLDPLASEIAGDPDRLQQVVWNLLSNAIKFTPHGGQVDVQLKRIGVQIQLKIKDTGKGITADFIPHAFERFRQADSTTTRKYGGLGIGLALVRHLTELHGGTVQAESPGEGQGATFTVTLPASENRAKETESKLVRISPIAHNNHTLSGVHILVVDDEPDTRALLCAIFEESGANVTAVCCARDALEHFDRKPPDVLVSDIGMPEIDGYALIRNVRGRSALHGNAVPAVALTAYAKDEDREKALTAGFQKHLSKPIDPSILIDAVASLSVR